MKTNILKKTDLPPLLRAFLIYIQTILGKSEKTTSEYYLDLKMYLSFLKKMKQNLDCDIDEISISDIDLDFIRQITLMDTYEFLNYLANDRPQRKNSQNSKIGISARSRARKISAIKAFFKYLVDKSKVLEVNPVATIDFPAKIKENPKFLNLDESVNLLNSIDGKYRERDFCIIMLFLSTGIRVSELVGINLSDIDDKRIRILGKGNKERMVFINDACEKAINDYKKVRLTPNLTDKDALFTSRQGNRINVQTVNWLVKKYVNSAGLENKGISSHKLRHTAATLMYSNGVDIRTLQEVLGHKNLDTTMIYTHIESSDLRDAAKINPISNVEIKQKTKTENN